MSYKKISKCRTRYFTKYKSCRKARGEMRKHGEKVEKCRNRRGETDFEKDRMIVTLPYS